MPFALRRRFASLAPALLVASATVSAAQTVRRVPEDFPTIGAAIAASTGGDEVVVGPGEYRESLLLTEETGSGIVVRSVEGAAMTTIVYGDSANANGAVVTLQRCSDTTQLRGFTIDGRGAAVRGILVASDSKPLLADLDIRGCEYGVASHKGSTPVLREVTADSSRVAGLLVVDAGADVTGGGFTRSAKFGVYVESGTGATVLRDVDVLENGRAGIQVIQSETSIEGGRVARNGDCGIVMRQAKSGMSGVTVEGHTNVGIVLESSDATVSACTIADNEYGVVVSRDGAPRIVRSTFRDNRAWHVSVEGEAAPVLGGSLEDANRFLGSPRARVHTTSSAGVDATYDFWDAPCATDDLFVVRGTGTLRVSPWASGDLLRSFEDCAAAQGYMPAPTGEPAGSGG